MFNTLLQQHSQNASEREGYLLTGTELDELVREAKTATATHPAEWHIFKKLLVESTKLDKKKVTAIFNECKITADLGCYPNSTGEFISAFLKSRGYKMTFSGAFSPRDRNYIENEMNAWSAEILGGKVIYSANLIRGQFDNWIERRKDQLQAEAYAMVMHDPTTKLAGDAALKTFVNLITDGTEADQRAAYVIVKNFIWRTKNHLRKTFQNATHVMPIFYGPQGSGKTTVVTALLKPLADMTDNVGFDTFEHDEKMYQLSVTPVLFFDELSNVTKAEVERVKDVMHAEQRQFRKLYASPVTRRVVSTFIGCTNREVSSVIKDETGNRRFFQITTPLRIDLEAVKQLDFAAIWTAVDEDEPAPLYANSSDLAAVQTAQHSQRHISPIEHWLDTVESVDSGSWNKSSDLFAVHFSSWFELMYPHQSRFINAISFGRQLAEAERNGHPRLSSKNGSSTKLWQITPPTPALKLVASQ